MSKRTIILIIALLAVTLGLLAIALAPKKPAPPAEKVGSRPAPTYAHTILKLSPPTATSSGLYSSTVSISSGDNKDITGVQLELSFDKSKIQIVDIKPGSFFPTPTELLPKKFDNVNGTISYALIAGIGKKGAQGDGDVATITFKEIGKAGDIVKIKFEPKSLVTSLETDQSVLKTTTGTTFTIDSPAAANSATSGPQRPPDL